MLRRVMSMVDRRWLKQLALLAVVGVSCIVLLAIADTMVREQDDLVNSDFFTFWLGGRLVVAGADPYAEAQWLAGHQQYGSSWFENPIYPYPLPLAILLIPLGLLPVDTAGTIWIWLSEISMLLAVGLLMVIERIPFRLPYLLPIVAGLILWRPVEITLLNGQLGAWLLLLVVIAVVLWTRERWFSGGAVIALVALKPTIGLPLIGLIGIWLIARRAWRAVLGMAIVLGGLVVAGWLRDPNWIGKMLWIGSQKLNYVWGYNPTVWGLGGMACSNTMPCTFLAGAGLSVAVGFMTLFVLLRHSRRYRPLVVVSGIIPVVLLVTPYLWVYDQILLLVSLMLLMSVFVQQGRPYLVIVSPLLGAAVLSLILFTLAFQLGRDTLTALVPLIAWALGMLMGRDAAPTLVASTQSL